MDKVRKAQEEKEQNVRKKKRQRNVKEKGKRKTKEQRKKTQKEGLVNLGIREPTNHLLLVHLKVVIVPYVMPHMMKMMNELWLQCENCEVWCHKDCAGYGDWTEEDLMSELYMCDKCQAL